jgi:hypothetical protein
MHGPLGSALGWVIVAAGVPTETTPGIIGDELGTAALAGDIA